MSLFLRPFLLAIALSSAASVVSAAAAGSSMQIHVINGSRYPIIGFELETIEPGRPEPSSRSFYPIAAPVLPGALIKIHIPLDPAVPARGGKQHLRWYWTVDRRCSNYVVATPNEWASGTNTGEHRCNDGTAPAPVAADLNAGIALVNARKNADDPVGAIMIVNALMAQFPGQKDTWHARGMLYARSKQPGLAESDFRTEMQYNPDKSHAHFDAAMLHVMAGNLPLARGQLDKAIELSPGNAGYLEDRAYLHCRLGSMDGMRDDLAQASRVLGVVKPPLGSDCR